MTAKHAAMPWKRDKYGTVVDANGETIVLSGFALNTGHRSEVAEANDDFVFRACAAHDDLVKALNDTLNMLRAAHMQLGIRSDDNKRVINAKTVLAKAKGETK